MSYSSTSEKYTLGVDFGTLSARAVLVDVRSGEVVCDSVKAYTHGVMDKVLAKNGAPLPKDFALQDAADYIEAFRTVVMGVIEDSGIDEQDIIGVGVDFTCCTLIPVDANATPLSFYEKFKNDPHAYVKLWKHHAAQPYADRINELAETHCPELLARFGGKISPEWAFPKIMEVLDRAPDVFDAADFFIEAGDFITWLLTGEQTRGYDYAAYKALYHHEKGYPEREFLAMLDKRLENIADTKLKAPIVHTATLAGRVSADSRERFGIPEGARWLPTGIAVACPMPDGHTLSAALNASADGDMFAIFGTSSNYMLISSQEKMIDGICGIAKDGLYPGFYGYESGLCCFGDHLAWAADNILPASYHDQAVKMGISDIEYISKKAESLAPGANGLVAINWFNGNRNPLVDYSLSGAFIGLTLTTAPEEIFRALVEANAFGTRLIIENFEQNGIKVGQMTAAGGIAIRSPFIVQLMADVLGKEFRVASYLHSSALSGAIYAAVAAGSEAGGYDSLNEACTAMSDPCPTVYTPNPEAHEIYDALYREYLCLVNYFGRGTNDVMKRLKKLSSEIKEHNSKN